MLKITDIQAHSQHVLRVRWPQWAGYAAALWSLIYGLLGLYWALGGAGFPFGSANDPHALESILAGVQAGWCAPVVAGLGLAGTLVALVMAWGWGRGLPHILLLSFASLFAVALLLVIPDRRALMAVAYAPLFLVGAPFHWPPVSFLVAIPWPVINQFILMVGGILWATTALFYWRRTHGVCVYCGRVNAASPASTVRWERWAVAIAVTTPILYAATRWAWALGIPLGISEKFLRAGQASGLWIAGAGLASVAVGGAILTLGLVQRWGEIFPRWMVGLAGKRVPPMLAIVPASFVSLIVTSGGLEYVRLVISSASTGVDSSWTTMGPETLWPIWGIALAAATFAYYLRRRGRCKHCGRL